MQSEELRKAYRSTWLEWARHTDALQQTIEKPHPDRTQLEERLNAVERARAAHNEARDSLAQVLGQTPAPAGAPCDDRVRATARLLWELSGRPDGTADSDWRSAQSMVRTASACNV
jgi:hypothetical protein